MVFSIFQPTNTNPTMPPCTNNRAHQPKYNYFLTRYQFMAAPSAETVNTIKPRSIKALDMCNGHFSLVLFQTQTPHTKQFINQALKKHDVAAFHRIELAFDSIDAIAQPDDTIATVLNEYTWMWTDGDDNMCFEKESLSSDSSWSFSSLSSSSPTPEQNPEPRDEVVEGWSVTVSKTRNRVLTDARVELINP